MNLQQNSNFIKKQKNNGRIIVFSVITFLVISGVLAWLFLRGEKSIRCSETTECPEDEICQNGACVKGSRSYACLATVDSCSNLQTCGSTYCVHLNDSPYCDGKKEIFPTESECNNGPSGECCVWGVDPS